MTTKFEIGKTYVTRSAVDADHVHAYEITRRTAKSIWTNVRGEIVRRGVRVGEDGIERFDPLGRYSMSPVISADRVEQAPTPVAVVAPASVPATARVSRVRPYQQAIAAIAGVELMPQSATGRVVEALKQSSAIAAENAAFNQAVEFLTRFCGSFPNQAVKREHIKFVISIISMMNSDDFADLDLIREYLRSK